MITSRITVAPHVAEYLRGRYGRGDEVVHFPPGHDIYHLLYDLLQRRPADAGVDRGNLEIALPDRRIGDAPWGKNPETYNYLSERSARILAKRFTMMMWAELHDFMDEQKHVHGVKFSESAYMFLTRYCIESISEDALLKNYQRWRQKSRRRAVRAYTRRADRKKIS